MKDQSRGRPRGAGRSTLSSWASGRGGFTMRDVIHSFNWPLGRTNSTLRRAVAAGDLAVSGTVRHEQAKRPVAVYVATAPVATVGLGDVLRCWHGV